MQIGQTVQGNISFYRDDGFQEKRDTDVLISAQLAAVFHFALGFREKKVLVTFSHIFSP